MIFREQVVFPAVVCLVFSTMLLFGAIAAEAQEKPVFTDYRGVSLGMSAANVREKLGKAEQSSDAEDNYEFSGDEYARILYDGNKAVRTISVTFDAKDEKTPKAEKVFGKDVPPAADGSVFKMERYEDEGFWISYVRTSGDDPVVIITLQKI